MARWLMMLIIVVCAGCGAPRQMSGNHHISEREMLAIARRPLQAWQDKQRLADVSDAAEAMRAYLADQGFANAAVDFSIIGDLPHFTVTEGKRVSVGKIEIKDRGILKKDFLVAAEERLRPWYIADSVDSMAMELEQGYRRIGHITAHAGEPKIVWNADRSSVDVFFTIEPGPLYTVRQETIEWKDEVAPEVKKGLTALLDAPGTVFDLRLGVRTSLRLRSWLTSRGYINATVIAKDNCDLESGTASPTFVIDIGKIHYFGVLKLEFGSRNGDGKTRFGFIASRFSKLLAGKPIDQAVIDQAHSGLYSTGLFTGVTVDSSPDETSGLTNVLVKVTEAKHRRFDFSIGYGSYEQLRGGIEYVDEHLFGQGLRLNSAINGSLKGWGTNVGLSDPFRFGPGRTVGVDVGFREREEPSFSHREVSTTFEAIQRFRPTFDDARWELRGQYEYKLSEDFAIEGGLSQAEIDGRYRSSTITGRIRRDSRGPRVLDPRYGNHVQLSAGWNAKILGSDIPYTELGADWSGYARLGRRLIGTVHLGGIVKNPSDDTSLPIGERLFLGGEDSVRSFAQDQLGPADANGDPVGGLSSGVANVELRYRPWRRWPNIEVAGFYDIGAIGQEPWYLDSPPGQGVGGGLRYITPVGPIRIDAAYNPGERFAANDAYAIHATVGFAF